MLNKKDDIFGQRSAPKSRSTLNFRWIIFRIWMSIIKGSIKSIERHSNQNERLRGRGFYRSADSAPSERSLATGFRSRLKRNPATESAYFTSRIRSPRFLHGCPRTDDWPCRLTMTPSRAALSCSTRHSRACERPRACVTRRNHADTALRENVRLFTSHAITFRSRETFTRNEIYIFLRIFLDSRYICNAVTFSLHIQGSAKESKSRQVQTSFKLFMLLQTKL